MNQLEHFEDFEAVLAQYQPSEAAARTLAKTKLVLLVGASSSGRNTIINRMVETGDCHFIVSDTTRQPRRNNGILEQDGREYWFRKESDLLDDLRRGMFLEAEIIHGQQVSGISIRELEQACEQHKAAVTDVDIGGIQNIMRAKPDTLALMVVPPSYAQWQERMRTRGEMDKDEWRKRMETACRIFTTALANPDFLFLVTHDVADSVAKIAAMIHDGSQPVADKQAGQAVTKQLLLDTQSALDNL